MNFLSLKIEAFGLDINNADLKIAAFRKIGKSAELSSLKKAEIAPGIMKNGEIKDIEALAKIIKEAVATAGGKTIETKYVVASLPEEKSFLQVIQMPKMEEKDLQSAILFEAENYIPLPISQVYLDFQVISASVKNKVNHLDILLVAMPKSVVDSYVLCIKKAGLIPFAFEVKSEAIARALIKGKTSSSQIIILDIEKDSAVFIAFAGGSVRFTASIPVLPQKQFFDQIEKYLSFYQNHAFHEHIGESNSIEKIILCGEEAGLKELSNSLSEKLKIKTELEKNYSSFSAAIGLALRP